ncbi:hypothetical protein EW146_g7803 [Bondarzewia mesenterica]|uniref:Uncharacterized protein n=1 Tax=Bondarzewia mesenterica TaxID=1095465 RepID=A0A4S4LL94_9AGAM|nr:hypothetical protein EW146_g7803 [Bondarzewia mesenterica]
MFSKSFFASLLILALSSQVHAHALISPPLGVSGTPNESDVQFPSSSGPCGNVDIASNIDSSTAVPAAADGSFAVTVTNFNGGEDGSRQIVRMNIDASGVGKTFASGTMLVNGEVSPAGAGSQQLSAQLPAGTKCKGGKAENLCLASFVTAGSFGNCVVVSQRAAAALTGNYTIAAGKSLSTSGTATVSVMNLTAAAPTATASGGGYKRDMVLNDGDNAQKAAPSIRYCGFCHGWLSTFFFAH